MRKSETGLFENFLFFDHLRLFRISDFEIRILLFSASSMFKPRRTPRKLASAIVMLILFCAPASAADKLRIGYGAPSVTMSILWITKEGKLFEKNGLDVEVLYLESALVQRR